MIQAFYSGVAGAKSFQTQIDVGANNIANAGTNGFKEQQSAFADLMYVNLPGAEGEASNLKTGSGVKVSDISPALEEGPVEVTGRPYDVALLGEGYFCVQDDASNTYFTRAGNFCLKKNGESSYLATANGDLVLNEKLEPIVIAEREHNVRFGAPALEAGVNENENENVINLAVFAFDNPYALIRDGYGRLQTTAGSGEGAIYYGAKISQGALEGSNVDLASEMTNLLQAQRGFQCSVKIIQTADELEGIANSLRA